MSRRDKELGTPKKPLKTGLTTFSIILIMILFDAFLLMSYIINNPLSIGVAYLPEWTTIFIHLVLISFLLGIMQSALYDRKIFEKQLEDIEDSEDTYTDVMPFDLWTPANITVPILIYLVLFSFTDTLFAVVISIGVVIMLQLFETFGTYVFGSGKSKLKETKYNILVDVGIGTVSIITAIFLVG